MHNINSSKKTMCYGQLLNVSPRGTSYLYRKVVRRRKINVDGCRTSYNVIVLHCELCLIRCLSRAGNLFFKVGLLEVISYPVESNQLLQQEFFEK